jgi:trans-feruloyl-CoA hydratase/vanillin synthase
MRSARVEFDPDAKVVVVPVQAATSARDRPKEIFRELENNLAERKRAALAANCAGSLFNYEKPSIAMVHGYCVGGAFMQLCGCDFAVAAENAKFSLSEVNWGILPGALVAKVVADIVLPRHALFYACLGDPFDGKEAARIGLVNYAVPEDKLESAVEDLAKRLMAKSPNALRGTKQAIRHVRTMDTVQAYDYLSSKSKEIKVGTSRIPTTRAESFLDDKSCGARAL